MRMQLYAALVLATVSSSPCRRWSATEDIVTNVDDKRSATYDMGHLVSKKLIAK